MIFPLKKVICIILLHLFFIIVNDANGSPLIIGPIGYAIKGVKIVRGATKNKIKKEDVKFYFASQDKPYYITAEMTDTFDPSFDHIIFDPCIDTVLISHGFLSSGRDQWLKDMKDPLLNYAAYNVIIVDWEKGSSTWNYLSAAANTKIVGNAIAELFRFLRNEIGKRYPSCKHSFGKIHFVGHSLGAHIVAHAANAVIKRESKGNNWMVNRITGLDPAQPCFALADIENRLDEYDAEFVDVIHTNAQHFLSLGFGMPARMGYVDFYPDGGKIQIGCDTMEMSIWNGL